MSNVRSLQDTDPGEHALRIAKGLDRRMTLVEEAQMHLELKLEKLIRAEGKRSAARLSMIGAIGVALIGGFTQWQVARYQTQAQLQTAATAKQKERESERTLESVIEEVSRRSAKAALEERERKSTAANGR